MSGGGIYEIVNVANGKRYVGSAVNLSRRWREHRRRLALGDHHSRRLLAAWDKHGASVFVFRPILICAKENLLMYEQILMDSMNPEYNIRTLARSNLGVKYSAESRARMSAASKGNKGPLGWKRTPEHCANIAAAKRGKARPDMRKPRSEETKAKIRVASLGNNYAKGAVRSPETRAKMSAARLATVARKRAAQ